MKLRKYGLTLSRLTQDEIEFVRRKRNSEEVRRYMEFREEITPEMQQQWFDRINNFDNFYYIIEYKGRKIGLINDKNMDWQARTSESGLFFWDQEYINTFFPILTSLVLLDVGFYYLDWHKSFIHVMKDNPKAIEYVHQIGYKLCEGQDGVQNQLYFLTKENFEKKGRKMRQAAESFKDKEFSNGYVLLEPQDYKSGLAQTIENYFAKTGILMNRIESEKGIMFFR
jgi:UDP-4-amino-4,6-dideoxy-N-acetyl-beta-L-altrosamine N-acetyltransferase